MKHAFLIIAHNEPYVLKTLLEKLRHPDNTCFVHIDKKVDKNVYYIMKKIINNEGGVFVNKRISVKWGDFSQIECEMILFEFALAFSKKFDYFHLLSGVDLPIKPIEYIHNFFEKNKGYEFLRVANTPYNEKDIYNKINFYHLFMPFSRTLIGKILRKGKLSNISIAFQKIIGVSRCANDEIKFYKGYQWCSLTKDAVQYLISKKTCIYKRFRYTCCPDEIYKQTILMNSIFREKIWKQDNTAMREIDWKRGKPYTWKVEDKFFLLNESTNLFARKFSSKYSDIIKYISVSI